MSAHGERNLQLADHGIFPEESYQQSTENLAWLIAILNRTADELERWGSDIDANVLRAHAGQLARGKQWPGDDFSTLELARDGAAS